MAIERASAEGNGVADTQLSPGDSFSDVDSQIGELVAGLGAAPGPPQFGAGSVVAGHFEIVRKLGQGGMGVVFLARDRRLDREVAIKLVGRRSALATARLEREAQAMAQLAHPNVVAVHEVGQHDGSVYIAMEYVDGSTLRIWQAGERRGWREIVETYLQAARGLAAAHATGFVHRDFKPDNVLVGRDGRARVADFGLARTLGSLEVSRERVASVGVATPNPTPVLSRSSARDAGLTASDAVLGTPAYMAPEQFNSSVPLGPAVDQFAFGVALHEAVTGVRPFGEVPSWVATDADRVAVPADRAVPRWLRQVLRRALDLDPKRRYVDMRELAGALERGLGLARARRRWALGLVGVGAAVAIGVGVGTSSRHSPCSDAAAAANQVWHAQRREELAATFASDGDSGPTTWGAVAPLVAEWMDRWVATRTAGCQATRVDGSQSEALLDRQVACLDSRLGRVAAVLAVLERDRAPRQRVDELVANLPDVSICADPTYLLARVAPPEDPAVRDEVTRLADLLQHESVRLELGDVGGLEDRVRALVASADAVGWDPIAARARWILGRTALVHGKRDEAAAVLRSAYFTARGAGDDETAASVALSLGYLDGVVLNERPSAEVWLQHAESDVRRGAASPHSRVIVEVTRGQIRLAAGDGSGAVEAIERAIALSDEQGSSSIDRLTLQYELAAALDAAGRHTEALVQYDAMIEESTRLLGPQAQRVGMLHNNRGLARYYVRDFPGAIDDLQRALEIETTIGTPEVNRAPVRLNLGLALAATGAFEASTTALEGVRALWKTIPDAQADAALVTKALAWVALRQGDHARAHGLATEALALARGVLEPEHPEVAASAALLGDTALALGEVAEAVTELEAAQRIWQVAANVDNPGRIDTMATLAEAYLAAERLADARALVDEVLRIAATTEADDSVGARAHFVRARIHARAGDRAAADADARRALALYSQPLFATEIEAIERWLAR